MPAERFKERALNSMEDNQEVDILIKEMRAIRISDSKTQFPYNGCRKLYRETGKQFEDLVPNLNTYFMDIFGYSSWDFKIAKWSEEKLKEAQKWMSRTFFEKHPQYLPLQSLITEVHTPDLYAAFTVHEELRVRLLKLCDVLLKQTQPENKQ